MHEQILARAAMPQPVVCLGLLLRPYSIGHHLLLTREGLLEAEPDFTHLAHAVLICCQTWLENQRMPFDRLLNFKLWIWRWRIKRRLGSAGVPPAVAGVPPGTSFPEGGRAGTRNRTRETRVLPIETELAKFRDYLTAGNSAFPVSDTPRAYAYDTPTPRLPGSPFLIRLQQFVIRELGIPEPASYDYPLALANMHWCAYHETEGSLDIYNEHDAQFDRYVEEQESRSGAFPGADLTAAGMPPIQPNQPDTSHNGPSAER